MIKLWNQESVDWRLELQAKGEGDSLPLRMGDQPRQLLVELGEAVTPEVLRRAAAKAVKTACEYGAESALLEAPAAQDAGALSAMALGAALARYRQESWKERKDKPFTLYIACPAGVDGEQALAESAALAKAVCFARDLVNCPANKLTPMDMARRMTEAAQKLGV